MVQRPWTTDLETRVSLVNETNMSHDTDVAGEHDDIIYPSALPFVLVHLSCIAAIWSGVTWQAIAICVALYWLRIFAIGAGYHRYFSHRAYSTSRAFQFVLAFLAQSNRPEERSVVGCQAPAPPPAFRYRARRAFTPAQGLYIQPRGMDFCSQARHHRLGENCRFRALSRVDVAAQSTNSCRPLLLGALCFLAAGWSGLVVGFFWSTVLLYHATFCINSLAHVRGQQAICYRRRFSQQLALGALYDGRGLAQQSPRLSKQRSARLQMVGNRRRPITS